jgi:hypothetical protein
MKSEYGTIHRELLHIKPCNFHSYVVVNVLTFYCFCSQIWMPIPPQIHNAPRKVHTLNVSPIQGTDRIRKLQKRKKTEEQ